MTRFIVRWGLAGLAALVPLAVIGVPILAQQPEKQPQPHPGKPRAAGELERAKEIAALVEKGQLKLRDAVELAEKHVKGTALEVRCEVQAGKLAGLMNSDGNPAGGSPVSGNAAGMSQQVNQDPVDQPRPHPGQPPKEPQPAEKRLVYEVCCMVKEKIHTVQVDGLTRKILDVKESN